MSHLSISRNDMTSKPEHESRKHQAQQKESNTASIQNSNEGANKKEQKSRRRDQSRQAREVNVLLLTFQYHDLGSFLDKETEHVRKAFQTLKYKVSEETIQMGCSLDEIKEQVNRFLKSSKRRPEETLYIIYYHGHGDVTRTGEFTIARLEKTNTPFHLYTRE